MRTIITKARRVSAKLKRPFRSVINTAPRIGLIKTENSAKNKPYKTNSHPMGLKQGYNIDHIQELLEQIEDKKSK